MLGLLVCRARLTGLSLHGLEIRVSDTGEPLDRSFKSVLGQR